VTQEENPWGVKIEDNVLMLPHQCQDWIVAPGGDEFVDEDAKDDIQDLMKYHGFVPSKEQGAEWARSLAMELLKWADLLEKEDAGA
jgi:hypothetical protein